VLDEKLLTVGEVALRLRQSPRTVRDKIAAGTLPAVRIGDGPRAPIRIVATELEAWLVHPRKPVAAAGGPAHGGRGPRGGETA
jgi:excisionase family DNA binding protein